MQSSVAVVILAFAAAAVAVPAEQVDPGWGPTFGAPVPAAASQTGWFPTAPMIPISQAAEAEITTFHTFVPGDVPSSGQANAPNNWLFKERALSQAIPSYGAESDTTSVISSTTTVFSTVIETETVCPETESTVSPSAAAATVISTSTAVPTTTSTTIPVGPPAYSAPSSAAIGTTSEVFYSTIDISSTVTETRTVQTVAGSSSDSISTILAPMTSSNAAHSAPYATGNATTMTTGASVGTVAPTTAIQSAPIQTAGAHKIMVPGVLGLFAAGLLF